MKTLERQETLLNQDELINLMLGIYQKVENQTIETDRQLIAEVKVGLRPFVNHPYTND